MKAGSSRSVIGRLDGLLTVLAEPRLCPAFALAAVVTILELARDLSFQGDEWEFIVDRRLTIESLLRPHNEHLAAIHILVYRGMVEAIGIGSYLPFMAVLMMLHVISAAGLLVLLRRHIPAAGAMAATVLFLFLGSGFDNLLWAFQIGFVGSVAFGVWALVVADRPAVSDRSWIAAVLLTASIWTSSVGLFFVLPLALIIRRRAWLVVPIGSYVAWYLLIGRQSIPFPDPGPYLAYAATALGSGFAGVSGIGFGGVQGDDPWLGLLVAAAVALAIVGRIARGVVPSRFVLAGVAGLIAEYAVLAFGRAHFGTDEAMAPRYIYVAMPFISMVLTGLPRLPRVVWLVLFIFALVSNLVALPRGVAIYEAFLHYDRSIPLEQRLAPFR